jgi:transcriptional regulator with GAF, ATPase, and Fis domain
MALALRHRQQARELQRTKNELASANACAADQFFNQARDTGDFEEIIGDSRTLRIAQGRVQEVAPTDASVMIFGETGTGKELFARAVHKRSARRDRPFVRVNCAALPPTLIESELFGHERGAFTGAVAMRQGRFELAHRGTLFLDEIGDLPADVQSKLLRVLQEGEFERVGSSQSRRVDVRVIAATHRDLDEAVREGQFRADLYYRLNVFPIALPPLRERIDDIPRLVWFFVNRRQRALNRKFTNVPASVMAALQQHPWPGNVRELENVVERAMIHSTGGTLLLDDSQVLHVATTSRDAGTLQSIERRHIEEALRRSRWRINGPGNAAEALGLHPNTLRFRMKKLGIQRPGASSVVRDFSKRLLA